MEGGATRMRVGFAGLGKMGKPMVRRLIGAGFPVMAWNRTPKAYEELGAPDVSVAAAPSRLAGCDVVITMLADGDAVEQVLCGPDGVLAGIAEREGDEPLLVIEMSTIGPLRARQLAERCREAGAEWMDAPVSGSVAVAEQGQLMIMAGGEPSSYERAQPLFEAMGKGSKLLGPAGVGAAMKLCLNLLIAATNHSLSEALVLAEKAGLEREAAYDVISSSAVASPFVAYKRPNFLDPDGTPPAFALELMRKDLALAFELAEDAGVELGCARANDRALELAAARFGGDEDLVRVADLLRAG